MHPEGSVALWNRFTDQAKQAVYAAQEAAAAPGLSVVEPWHLLIGALHDEETIASQVLAQLGLDREAICKAFAEEPAAEPASGEGMRLSDPAKRVIDRAYETSRGRNSDQLNTVHLLLGVLGDPTVAARLVELGSPLTLVTASTGYEHLVPSPAEVVSPPASGQVRIWSPPVSLPLVVAGFVLLWLWRLAVEVLLVASGALLLPAGVLLSRGWLANPNWGPASLASVWTALVVPPLCFGLGIRGPRWWAAIEAFLFCKGAFGLALWVLLSTVGVWLPMPFGAGPAIRPGQPVGWVLLATVLTFYGRDQFSVKPREGWRTLWRHGGWMLGVTALVEAIHLGAIAGLLR
jgi:hypothetical protein